jgi:hypothetical protein
MSSSAKKVDQFSEQASTSGLTGMIPADVAKNMPKEALRVAEQIFEKVEKAGGKAALQRCIESGGSDLPPMKLTNQEMEFLKGGYKGGPTFQDVCAGIGAATAIWGSIAASVT